MSQGLARFDLARPNFIFLGKMSPGWSRSQTPARAHFPEVHFAHPHCRLAACDLRPGSILRDVPALKSHATRRIFSEEGGPPRPLRHAIWRRSALRALRAGAAGFRDAPEIACRKGSGQTPLRHATVQKEVLLCTSFWDFGPNPPDLCQNGPVLRTDPRIRGNFLGRIFVVLAKTVQGKALEV